MSEEAKLKKIKQFAARRKEVVILSDYSWQLKYEEFQKIAKSSHIHNVQILSPIDIDREVRGVMVSALRISRPFEEKDYQFDQRHLIQLSTSERYLEKFIKEMR